MKQHNVVQQARGILINALLYSIVKTSVNTSAENRNADQSTLTNLVIDSLNRNLSTVE